ncbi:MAG: hypothetical protein JSU63_05560, partial [Phycisphaerales bacterium]
MNRTSFHLFRFVSITRVNLCGMLAIVTIILLATAGAGGKGEDVAGAPEEATSQPRQFAPGVKIDWQRRVVEVDASVVLREGPLELLACSPQTREHESILAVRARPLHIYQAMGLIG